MRALMIGTNGDVCSVDLSVPVENSLRKDLQGNPTILHPKRLKKPLCMVVDGNGVRKNLPRNELASWFYGTDDHGHPIVGPVFILKRKTLEAGYEWTGLTPAEIKRLQHDLSSLVEVKVSDVHD